MTQTPRDPHSDPSVREERVVQAEREIGAPAELIFELIADPSRQPEWDGNENLAEASSGQRVRGVGEVFGMTLTNGQERENRIVDFEEGRVIAWKPAPAGEEPRGHIWRYDLTPVDADTTLVRHTYDWSGLWDETRYERARATREENLRASLDRLAELAEAESSGPPPGLSA
ncbi:SRPBCC family protein [Micrococcus terreus]|uniref:SRPBCC family protein n=1 Tax=Micrococcus terreus TaxID=574650 RepID=UPI003D754AB0